MKNNLMHPLSFAILLYLVGFASAQEGQQQFADLGDFKLESGATIRNCRLGYRTFGQMDSTKSNVIVFPTWFTGTSKELIEEIGPKGLIDSSRFFVVAIDALGDGVSSSPSNSKDQPHMSFPKFSIRDMVESEHELMTKIFHLNHVKAVMGISMGGMQTFQWMVSYPGYMDYAVPIVGSPKLAPYDIALWTAENDAIRIDPTWKNGDYTEQPARLLLFDISNLVESSPARFNEENTREKLDSARADASKNNDVFDANNHIMQSEAMMGLDVSRAFGGSMQEAAAAVKAKVLIVVGVSDHMVTPGPALEFARLLHAQVLELQNNCGHGAPGCERERVAAEIARFLSN
jgi:homoserine O-acetyltransferase/O-succinyltransferase